jgi:predicted alpha/beta-fold hydrolase
VYISPRTVVQLISFAFCSGLDFAPSTAAGRVFDKETPVIVALHGLTGGTLMKLGGIAGPVIPDIRQVGSHKVYVRHIIGPAVAPVEEGGLGYRAVVINFRGCT